MWSIAKAIAGFAAGLIGGGGTAAAVGGADMTLTGYIVVGALNGLIGFLTVYFSPANRPRSGGLY